MREMGDWRKYLMEQLADPENAINYLDVSLEEYQVDGDTDFFLMGLRNVVEAQGGFLLLLSKSGSSRRLCRSCYLTVQHRALIRSTLLLRHLDVDCRLNHERMQIQLIVSRMRIIRLHPKSP